MLGKLKKIVLVTLQRLQPVNDKTIIFEAYQATSYACSPRALFEQILKDSRFAEYNFVWVFRDTESHDYLSSDRVKLVKFRTFKYYISYAKAKYWINNGWLPDYIVKKKNQIYLQCWHGTPLKRLRADISGAEEDNGQKALEIKDTLRYDYFISPSSFATEKFMSAFRLKELGKEDIIIETGYPRNDFLYNFTKQDVEAVYKKLDIPRDKTVILYAPTWRDDQREGDDFIEKSVANFDYLRNELGDKYVILFRSHYNIVKELNFDRYKGFVYNVSHIDDINDLYIVSDILVTDYSSVFFDFASLRRPIIFYMYDIDHYIKLRGFYIDPNTLPGDIVKNEQDLVADIKSGKAYGERYKSRYVEFTNNYNYLDDGSASQRVIERVFF